MDEVVRSLQPGLCSNNPKIGFESFHKLRDQLSGLCGRLVEEVCIVAELASTNACKAVRRITQWATRYLRDADLEGVLDGGTDMSEEQQVAALQAISTMLRT